MCVVLGFTGPVLGCNTCRAGFHRPGAACPAKPITCKRAAHTCSGAAWAQHSRSAARRGTRKSRTVVPPTQRLSDVFKCVRSTLREHGRMTSRVARY